MGRKDKILWDKLCERPYRRDITKNELKSLVLCVGCLPTEKTKKNPNESHVRYYIMIDGQKKMIGFCGHGDKSVVDPCYTKNVKEFIEEHGLDEFFK